MKTVILFILAWAWFMGFLFFYLEGKPKPFWDPPTPRVIEELVEEVPVEAVPYCTNPETTGEAWKPGFGHDRYYYYAPCNFVPWKGAA
jgi:hypothetical protein